MTASVECDGGPNCQAAEHIEGCFATERRFQQVRPGEVAVLRQQLAGAVEELRQLRDDVQRVLNLRSSYDADRGNDVPLVGNLQARQMLERIARGQ